MMKYKEMRHARMMMPRLDEIGFRAYSQNEEDGILLYIFALIGAGSRSVVEICAEDGIECNAANLIISHGWHGLLFDGDKANIRRGTRFYQRCPDTWLNPPKLVTAWIDRDNVNDLIISGGFRGEIDLFSLDIDGVDYWVWDALHVVQPRVVVVEYRDAWGPGPALTVPYSREFKRCALHPEYWGASLGAFVALGRRKGYRLVGCNRAFNNAFFVKNDVGLDDLPEVPTAACVAPRYRQVNAPCPMPTEGGCVWQDVGD